MLGKIENVRLNLFMETTNITNVMTKHSINLFPFHITCFVILIILSPTFLALDLHVLCTFIINICMDIHTYSWHGVVWHGPHGQKALMYESQAMHKKEYTSYLLIIHCTWHANSWNSFKTPQSSCTPIYFWATKCLYWNNIETFFLNVLSYII